MAYLRLSTVSNDNWTARPDGAPKAETWSQRRYGAMPRRRRGGGHLLAGLVAIPMGVWGLWLLLGTPMAPDPPDRAPIARPLVFQVPPPGLTIVVDHQPPPSRHPETWGALPTSMAAPVAATPLADPWPALVDSASCRDAIGLAAQMTCLDPTLREADQRMAAAYDAVLAAGVSPPALGRSQARWLVVRDEAARSSPEDLLAAYQIRQGQLRSAAAALEQHTGSVGLDQRPASPARPSR
ncbi:hypothetical protein BH10PSE3_BH10PSE3_30200 [soil metagenome]